MASSTILSSIEQKEEAKGNEQHVKRIQECRQKVDLKFSNIFIDVMTVVDEHLIRSSSSGESSVFYYNMKGEYYRDIAKFKTGTERKEAAEQSHKAYKMATRTAKADLSPTHPIRLHLACNFSDFYYEIMNSPKRARDLAKQAFDEAISELDSSSEKLCQDSIVFMKLLREDFTLWTSDIPEDGAEDTRGRVLERLVELRMQSDSDHSGALPRPKDDDAAFGVYGCEILSF